MAAVILWLRDRYRLSERRGCVAIRFEPSVYPHRPTRDDEAVLRQPMQKLAAVPVRYGCRACMCCCGGRGEQ